MGRIALERGLGEHPTLLYSRILMTDLITEFEQEARSCIEALHELVCTTAQSFVYQDDSRTVREIQGELVKLLMRALVENCDETYSYELRLVPEWMRGISLLRRPI